MEGKVVQDYLRGLLWIQESIDSLIAAEARGDEGPNVLHLKQMLFGQVNFTFQDCIESEVKLKQTRVPQTIGRVAMFQVKVETCNMKTERVWHTAGTLDCESRVLAHRHMRVLRKVYEEEFDNNQGGNYYEPMAEHLNPDEVHIMSNQKFMVRLTVTEKEPAGDKPREVESYTVDGNTVRYK